MPLGEIPIDAGHQSGVPPKKSLIYCYYLSRVRTVGDRHRLAILLLIIASTADELSGGTNVDDLERP